LAQGLHFSDESGTVPPEATPSVGPGWAWLDLSITHDGHLAAYRWREEDRGRPPSEARLATVRKGTA